MNWAFILRAGTYGLLWGVWTGALALTVLNSWPDALGWLKLGGGFLASFAGGVFTYTRNPEGAYSAAPQGGRR